ncbi:MAG: hypothetical protein LIO95_12350 [Clostridiales bacterium]|nr:hypothetical protein [Clostridiales bacterium]
MANLTSKELSALKDQLDFEHTCIVKYQCASQETNENSLKQCFDQYAGQHQQNFNTLLTFLK